MTDNDAPVERSVLLRRVRRRALLRAFSMLPAASLLAAAATELPAAPAAEGARLWVAGPDGGRLDRLSVPVADALRGTLPPGTMLSRRLDGGADGVSAANAFGTRAAPDGRTLLMVPGAAALAWLAGDTRARFDAASWVPVLAWVSPALLAGRLPDEALGDGGQVRIGIASPAAPELAAMLAIELLGAECVPMPGLHDAAAAGAALAAGRVDAILLTGQGVPARAQAVREAGGRILFSFGTPNITGHLARDPEFPDVPTLGEVYRRLRGAAPSGPLYAAWRSAAAAAALDFAVVLPALTPAAMVAQWRQAGAEAVASPALQAAASAAASRLLASPEATVSTTAIAARADALIELRRWLSRRFDWHPG